MLGVQLSIIVSTLVLWRTGVLSFVLLLAGFPLYFSESWGSPLGLPKGLTAFSCGELGSSCLSFWELRVVPFVFMRAKCSLHLIFWKFDNLHWFLKTWSFFFPLSTWEMCVYLISPLKGWDFFLIVLIIGSSFHIFKSSMYSLYFPDSWDNFLSPFECWKSFASSSNRFGNSFSCVWRLAF